MIPYMSLKTFSFPRWHSEEFFVLYDTLVHYMSYKDAIAPSAISDKNKKNTTIAPFFFLIWHSNALYGLYCP
jgi:hypothetical protein